MAGNADDLRDYLRRALAWEDAHVGFDKAVAGLPDEARGAFASELPYTAWQLLEHLRLTQRDILDFCRDPAYREPRWPDDYWPATPGPPGATAWEESVAAFRADREALQRLVDDPAIDLFAPIPHGHGQTYLREMLLILDHNAYHLGQLVTLRRALGHWPS